MSETDSSRGSEIGRHLCFGVLILAGKVKEARELTALDKKKSIAYGGFV
jgi:hypothetical protein